MDFSTAQPVVILQIILLAIHVGFYVHKTNQAKKENAEQFLALDQKINAILAAAYPQSAKQKAPEPTFNGSFK
jgi:Na+/H+-dicarboxylate symporter